MALGVGSLLELTLDMVLLGSHVMNVYQYQIAVAPSTKTADEIAEAWWNHVKAAYRALAITPGGRQFDSVTCRELNNPTGELAEYSIPTADQDGTRPAGSLGSYMPSFTSVGVRLTVGSRTTRPGQKRIPFLSEGDVANNDVGATFVGLVQSLMDVMTTNIVLGDPAELLVLDPIVTRKDATGAVTAHQPVTGYVINPYATTQVSRKIGRGV